MATFGVHLLSHRFQAKTRWLPSQKRSAIFPWYTFRPNPPTAALARVRKRVEKLLLHPFFTTDAALALRAQVQSVPQGRAHPTAGWQTRSGIARPMPPPPRASLALLIVECRASQDRCQLHELARVPPADDAENEATAVAQARSRLEPPHAS